MAAPARAAAEAAVGNERHGLVKAHAGYGRGGGEHLAHARPAFGPFIAYDHHIARLDLPAENGGNGIFFGIKDPCRAAAFQHFIGHGRLLHHRAVRGKIAAKDSNAALLVMGFIKGHNDIIILNRCPLQAFSQRLRPLPS